MYPAKATTAARTVPIRIFFMGFPSRSAFRSIFRPRPPLARHLVLLPAGFERPEGRPDLETRRLLEDGDPRTRLPGLEARGGDVGSRGGVPQRNGEAQPDRPVRIFSGPHVVDRVPVIRPDSRDSRAPLERKGREGEVAGDLLVELRGPQGSAGFRQVGAASQGGS